jgi:hypothetical protein
MALKIVPIRPMAVTSPVMTVMVVTVVLTVVTMVVVMVVVMYVVTVPVLVTKIVKPAKLTVESLMNAANAAVTDHLSNVLTVHLYVIRQTVQQKIRMYIL